MSDYPNQIILGCIPAFNEAKNIESIVRKAKKYCTEVIVCDDGSIDNTKEVAVSAGATVIKHNHNKGYGAAIKTLFQAAKDKHADVMVTLDSDGQHNVEDISKIIEPILQNKSDIVIGSRFLNEEGRKKVPFYRAIGIKTITKFAQAISFNKITDAQSGFRAYNKRAIEEINLIEDGMGVSTEILVKANELDLSIQEVPITISYDVDVASTRNPIPHGLGVLSTIIRFMSLRHPLEFYTLPGIVLLGIAVGFMALALELFSQTRFVSTNTILVSVGSAVVGVTLMVTGIILYSLKALFDEKLGKFKQ